MATKFLDNNGLLYLWQKIKSIFAEKSEIVTYSPATISSNGLMTSDMVIKLNGIATGANETIVDNSLSSSSTNPVQNKIVKNALDTKAPLMSPAFNGFPTAPTPDQGTNDGSIATTEFVNTAIEYAQIGVSTFQGTLSEDTLNQLQEYKAGWYWIVDTAGTYAGKVCEVGDFMYCVNDWYETYSASDFKVVQANLDLAAISNAEIDTIATA